MTTALPAPAPPVDAATRRLRLAGALLAAAARSALPASPTRRRRTLICGAARVLTALGVRVEVHAPEVAWPRPGTGRLVVANQLGWIGHLALATVVPGAPVVPAGLAARPLSGQVLRLAGAVVLDPAHPRSLPGTVAEMTERLRSGGTVLAHPEGTTSGGGLGRFHPAAFQAAVDAAVPVCPVALRHRTGPGGEPAAGSAAGESPWRSLRRAVDTGGLVVEVHLLPALAPADADRRVLAALSEYAVAAVTEARAPGRIDRPQPFRTSAPSVGG